MTSVIRKTFCIKTDDADVSATTCDDGAIRELEAIHHSHRISWLRGQKGAASVRVMRHKKAGWASFNVSESYVSENGKFVEKQVFITLSPAEVKELKKLLEAR